MPISQSKLESRLADALNMLSLHVQAGIEIQESLTKKVHGIVQHPCVEDCFFSDNAEMVKETISLLLEYIECLKRPHSILKTGVASPAFELAFRRGDLKAKGVTLLPPTASIMACFDDSENLKYYSIHKGV